MEVFTLLICKHPGDPRVVFMTRVNPFNPRHLRAIFLATDYTDFTD